MKILFLSRWFPFPANNGSKLRVYNLLRGLAEHHNVTLVSFVDHTNIGVDLSEARLLCSDVHVIPWRDFNPNSRKARLGFLNLTPRFLLDTYSEQMETTIREMISSKPFDLVIASGLSMASYYLSFGNVPAMFEEIELGLFHDEMAYAKNMNKRIRLGLTWHKLQRYLSHIIESFSICTVVSERERQLFISNFPTHKEKVTVLPNCVTFDEYQGLSVSSVSNQLIFSGPFRYRVNYDAMQWFIGEVYPIILDKMPETCLIITGDHENLPLPSAPNITLTGYVDDIKPLIASSRISIAPLLTGGGTRLKILEAMALGTPVVSTSKGAEGLDAIRDKQILIADSPNAFASQVIRILKDGELYKNLSNNGKSFVKENYNWQSMLPRFMRLAEKIVT